MVKSWQEVVIVSDELPEEVQRWTAKRRSALIVSIIRGETSVQEAVRKHGLTVAEVEDWREKFLLAAENALRTRPRDEEAQKDEQIKKLEQKVGELVLDMDILKEAQKGRPFDQETSDERERCSPTPRNAVSVVSSPCPAVPCVSVGLLLRRNRPRITSSPRGSRSSSAAPHLRLPPSLGHLALPRRPPGQPQDRLPHPEGEGLVLSRAPAYSAVPSPTTAKSRGEEQPAFSPWTSPTSTAERTAGGTWSPSLTATTGRS